MKKHLRFVLASFFCLVFSFMVNAQSLPVVKTNSTKVYIHYMPWFFAPQNPVTGTTYKVGINATGSWGFHWCSDGSGANPNTFTTITNYAGAPVQVRNVDAHYHPLIGPYDGEDTDVLQYHLLLMKYSGIDGIMIDWYGLANNGASDAGANQLNSSALISKMGSVGLKYGLVVEDGSMTNLPANLSYIASNYFTDSNYIKLGDMRGSADPNAAAPLVAEFEPGSYKNVSSWSNLGNTKAFLPLFGQAYNSVPTIAGGTFMWPDPQAGQAIVNGVPSWYNNTNSYYTGNATAIHDNYKENGVTLYNNVVLGTAYQGFFDFYLSNAASTTSDADGIIPRNYGATGNTLSSTLALAQANKSVIDGIQIATWNDFSEGTIVEPTVEFGFASLDTIQKFTGVSYTEADLQQIYRFFTLRKKYISDITKQVELNKVFNYFATLQVSNAIALMDTVDYINPNAPVVSVAAVGSPSVTGATGSFIISGTKIVSPITVNYTVGGTRPSAGYTANPSLSGSIVLTPSMPSDTIVITGLPDSIVVPGQTIILTLNTDTAYTIGKDADTLTVTDNRTPTCLGPMVVATSVAPVIDGAVDAIWAKAPTNAILQTVNGTLQRDYAAKWRAMYDSNYLYVLVEVKDSFLKNNAPASTQWENDAVEIYIDGTDSKATSYNLSDFQFGFQWGFAPLTSNMYGTTPRTGIEFAIPTVTGGYNLEAAIPWSTINGGAPFNGKQIGFDVEINDDDSNATRQATSGWYATASDAYNNPSVFGTATLTICNGDTALAAPLIISIDSTVGNKNEAFTYATLASNGPAVYSVMGLPAGLSLDTSSGIISGTPTVAGIFLATITATNAAGSGNETLSIFIDSLPTITSSDSINAKQYLTFSGYNITILNNAAYYNATGLPSGLTIDTLTGVISGTPTVFGNFNANILATNIAGTSSGALDILVDSTPAVHFVSINAFRQANATVAIQWSVDSELSIKQYEVQSSIDSINFNTVSIDTAIGNNNQSFTYNAIGPNTPALKSYYRIKGTSFNGDVYYSTLAIVAKVAADIYPNPLTGTTIYIPFNNITITTYAVRLINMVGQSVYSTTINNMNSGSLIYPLQLNKKPEPGCYELELLNENGAKILYKIIIE